MQTRRVYLDRSASSESRNAWVRSGGGTRTRDTTIMSRLLYHLSYPAPSDAVAEATPSREPQYGIEP
jgi:hypothetical protein